VARTGAWRARGRGRAGRSSAAPRSPRWPARGELRAWRLVSIRGWFNGQRPLRVQPRARRRRAARLLIRFATEDRGSEHAADGGARNHGGRARAAVATTRLVGSSVEVGFLQGLTGERAATVLVNLGQVVMSSCGQCSAWVRASLAVWPWRSVRRGRRACVGCGCASCRRLVVVRQERRWTHRARTPRREATGSSRRARPLTPGSAAAPRP
jgi:hypothetical protein